MDLAIGHLLHVHYYSPELHNEKVIPAFALTLIYCGYEIRQYWAFFVSWKEQVERYGSERHIAHCESEIGSLLFVFLYFLLAILYAFNLCIRPLAFITQ